MLSFIFFLVCSTATQTPLSTSVWPNLPIRMPDQKASLRNSLPAMATWNKIPWRLTNIFFFESYNFYNFCFLFHPRPTDQVILLKSYFSIIIANTIIRALPCVSPFNFYNSPGMGTNGATVLQTRDSVTYPSYGDGKRRTRNMGWGMAEGSGTPGLLFLLSLGQ